MHCVELCWPPPMLQPRLTFYTAKACASVTQWQASLTLLVVWMGADVAAPGPILSAFHTVPTEGLVIYTAERVLCIHIYSKVECLWRSASHSAVQFALPFIVQRTQTPCTHGVARALCVC